MTATSEEHGIANDTVDATIAEQNIPRLREDALNVVGHVETELRRLYRELLAHVEQKHKPLETREEDYLLGIVDSVQELAIDTHGLYEEIEENRK